MKTVVINGKKLDITEGEERVLRLFPKSNFILKSSDLWEGGRRGRYHIDPRDRDLKKYGLKITFKRRINDLHLSKNSKRARKFFKENVRIDRAIEGNPRRINLILKKLDEVA
jgi:hypothetical protein